MNKACFLSDYVPTLFVRLAGNEAYDRGKIGGKERGNEKERERERKEREREKERKKERKKREREPLMTGEMRYDTKPTTQQRIATLRLRDWNS